MVTKMKKQIDFYFDVVSPYSYVASKLIEDVEQRSNAEFLWKPFLLGGVFKAVESISAPGLVPVKKPYLIKDLQRLSKHYGIPLRMPPDFPVRTVLAMRALRGMSQEKIPEAAHILFHAYWSDNLDIADPKILATLIGQEAVENAGMQEVKDSLFQTTQEAVKRGAFGAPTFFVDDEMFFGHDRLILLENYLRK